MLFIENWYVDENINAVLISFENTVYLTQPLASLYTLNEDEAALKFTLNYCTKSILLENLSYP